MPAYFYHVPIDMAENCDTILLGRKMTPAFTQTAISGRNLEVENGDLAAAIQALKKEPV